MKKNMYYFHDKRADTQQVFLDGDLPREERAHTSVVRKYRY